MEAIKFDCFCMAFDKKTKKPVLKQSVRVSAESADDAKAVCKALVLKRFPDTNVSVKRVTTAGY